MSLILGVDPAWGGTAWVVAAFGVPVAWGRSEMKDPHRRVKLAALLERMEGALDGERMGPQHIGTRPRLAIEAIPDHYNHNAGGKFSAKRITSTVRGITSVQSAIVQHFVRPTWDYPWEVATSEWRPWWGMRDSAGRDALKASAVILVSAHWPQVLAGCDLRQPPKTASGESPPWPAGDIADACLIAVGASRHLTEAPPNPKAWR